MEDDRIFVHTWVMNTSRLANTYIPKFIFIVNNSLQNQPFML